MNLYALYSIIGGGAGALILGLIVFFPTQTTIQTDDEPIPIASIDEQIIPAQTNVDSTDENDNSAGNQELPQPSEPEEVVEPDIEPTPTNDSPSSVQIFSSSGGGGGGGGSGGGGGGSGGEDDDDDDSSSPDPGTWASIEHLYD